MIPMERKVSLRVFVAPDSRIVGTRCTASARVGRIPALIEVGEDLRSLGKEPHSVFRRDAFMFAGKKEPLGQQETYEKRAALDDSGHGEHLVLSCRHSASHRLGFLVRRRTSRQAYGQWEKV